LLNVAEYSVVWKTFFLIALSVSLAAGPVSSDPIGKGAGQDRTSRFMRVYGPTDPPYAFWRFCDEFPVDCSKSRTVDPRTAGTTDRLGELDRINRQVNRSVEPVTDLELYGVSDYWTLPVWGKGDCEDYALQKRRNLIVSGWPSSSLLVTVVRDEKGEGHAVLTARTSQGDYILDNKTDDLRLWSQTNYRYVMRQSYLDPKSWVALDPAQSAPPLSISVAGAE
jgi:predicted transglutaminase-like cysteine proteinase